MKGLYINVPGAERLAEEMAGAWGAPLSVHSEPIPPLGIATLAAHHDAREFFLSEPSSGLQAVFTGWVVYNGELGSQWRLARDLARGPTIEARVRTLQGIEAGCFTLLLVVRGEPWLVTDPFGLHAHYAPREGPFRALAPAPGLFAPGPPRNPAASALLERINHLFGNETGFTGVRRLDPGCLVGSDGIPVRYARYDPEPVEPAEILGRLRRFEELFDPEQSILPLSGGLDSRLLLASGPLDRGYTFGPAHTGDRPVARRAARRMRCHLEFSLLDLSYPQRARQAVERMFEGLCPRPFAEMIVVHRHVHDTLGGRYCFDGLFGDVLQRGLYLTRGGIRGGAAKLVPRLTLRRFDPMHFLRKKYGLKPSEAERLAAMFQKLMRGLDYEPAHRMVLFEMLHGRGSRHMVNGGTIMARQFFEPVQPFAALPVFRGLFAADARDWLTFRQAQRIWREVDPEYSRLRTSSGFAPVWDPHASRAVMLVTRALPKLGIPTRAVSYERELSSIEWI